MSSCLESGGPAAALGLLKPRYCSGLRPPSLQPPGQCPPPRTPPPRATPVARCMALAGSGPPWRGGSLLGACSGTWPWPRDDGAPWRGCCLGFGKAGAQADSSPVSNVAAATCPGDTFGVGSHLGQNPLLERFQKCLVLSQHRLSWGSHSPLHEDPGRLAQGRLSAWCLSRQSLGSRPGPSPIHSC